MLYVSHFLSFVYSQLPEIMSAFLGFGSALLVENLVDRNNQKKSIRNIAIELIDIRNQLRIYKDDKGLPPIFAYSVNIPIWEAVKGTGYLFEFRKKDYYLPLIHVYACIEKMIKLEDWLFENYSSLSEEEKSDAINKIVVLRNQTYTSLTTDLELVNLLSKVKF